MRGLSRCKRFPRNRSSRTKTGPRFGLMDTLQRKQLKIIILIRARQSSASVLNELKRKTEQMRFAYADPPYLGRAEYYRAHHPDAMIWDKPETHQALVCRLQAEYPD